MVWGGEHCDICAQSAREKFATAPTLGMNHALLALMTVSGRCDKSFLVVAMKK